MPQSLSRVLVHAVFGTKGRRPWIVPAVRGELHAYLAAMLGDLGCAALRVGGTEDHVHLLFALSRTLTLADTIEKVKTASSRWIKSKGPDFADFHWQGGYGAFSIGQSQADAVDRYIREQERHHAARSFEDELRALLRRYRVPFDERYLWD